MEYVFICKIKIIGSPFCVLSEDEAKDWVAEDPEMNYYDKVHIKRKVKPISEQLKEIWEVQ